MSIFLRCFLAVITVIYIIIILLGIKKNKINSYISLFWIISGCFLLFTLCVPKLIELIANTLGFEKASNMIFCLTIFIVFYLLYGLTVRVSENYVRCVKLTQKIALLEKKIKELEDEKKI